MARRNRKETGSEKEAERRIAKAARDQQVELDLSQLGLETLAESVAKLFNLQTLNLNHNQLSSLPDSIAKLSNLQTLILNGNQLSSLPDSITKLSNLQTLDLGD